MTQTQSSADIIDVRHGATLQHGPLNHRIYVMKLGDADPAILIPALQTLAEERGYTKIFAKIPSRQAAPFIDAGYDQEASVPSFFANGDDALFLCTYLDERRSVLHDAQDLVAVDVAARKKHGSGVGNKALPEHAVLRPCNPDDVASMAAIYAEVFPSYPFPIDSPDYLLETMQSHVDYFCIEIDGTMVALSSAEMDPAEGNVEMTDFATLPAWRGKGLAVLLLEAMEDAMKAKGLRVAYTIARAASYGMNITFSRLGYRFGGRLRNNTNISGRIESMNVWHKTMQ